MVFTASDSIAFNVKEDRTPIQQVLVGGESRLVDNLSFILAQILGVVKAVLLA